MSNKKKVIYNDNLQKKIAPEDNVVCFDAEFVDAEAAVEPQKTEESKSEMPKAIADLSIEYLQYYLGDRELLPFDNSDILSCRLFYQVKVAKKSYCSYIVNKKNKRKIGIVSDMQLRHSWRMAHSKDAKKAVKNDLFFMTFQEWERDCRALEKYIQVKKDGAARSIVYFSDVWALSEIEYECAGLKRPQQFMALLQTAILGEIEENKRLVRNWKKIKKYVHRVKLEKSLGGIFSDSDAEKIRASLRVKKLNDIRKYDIYVLKTLDLEYDFANIVKDINKAYKEDMARRRDRRYKIRPFVSAFINLFLVIFIGYGFQYRLLYEDIATYVIMGLLTVCVLDVLFIIFAGIRGKRRRLVRPDYVYYSKRVKNSIKAFAFIGIFAIMSIFVFYQRYDGYTETLYYRETDDGIAIAGLVDKEYTKIVNIPDTIDNKPVVEVDLYAFDNTDIRTVVFPHTLKSIDTAAFAGCYYLTDVAIPSSVKAISDSAFNNSGIVTLSLQNHGKIAIGDKAFKNCYKLKTIENSETIISIGNQSFYSCHSLGDLEFSKDLESIGKRAFYGCTSFKNVSVPSGTDYIGRGAFYYCISLETITVPFAGTSAETSSRESIGAIVKLADDAENRVSVVLNSPATLSGRAFRNVDWISSISLHEDTPAITSGAFSGMNNLKSIKLPETTTEISAGMFRGSTSLNEIYGMSGVTVIGDRAFYGCTSLRSVDLSSVEVIGKEAFSGTDIRSVGFKSDAKIHVADRAFKNCYNLESITNSTSIISTGKEAFYGCSSLTDIQFSDELEFIGVKSFYGCSSLTSILVPEGTKSIGKGAFHECNRLTSVTVPYAGTSAQTCVNESIESIVKPSSMYFQSVSVTLNSSAPVGRKAFKNVGWIKSIDLSDKITDVNSKAFSGMTNLESIKLPSTMTEIDGDMFQGANSLKRITGISGVKTIGSRAFYGCQSLEHIDLSGVNVIGSEAFRDCVNLNNIGNLSSLQAIGSYAFANCYGLSSSLDLYSSLKKIDDSAFSGSKFSSFNLEEGITEIGAHAFENCSNLTYISLPSTVTTIGDYAFGGCYNLYSADLSKVSAKTLGKYTFRSCSALEVVYLPKNVTEIPEGFFYNCQQVYGFDVIANYASLNIKSIGAHAFEQCDIREDLVISTGITTIGDRAFAGNYMRYLAIGGSVTTIGNEAFADCISLTEADIDSGVTSIGNGAFKNCKNLYKIYIAESVNKIGEKAFDECGTINSARLPFLGENNTDASTSFLGFGKNGGYSWVFGTTSVENIEITKMSTIYTNTFKGGAGSIKTVAFSSTTIKIEDSAFENFGSLTSVSLPSSIITIGEKAFKNCSALKNINIPSKVTTISKAMFENCYSLEMNISELTVRSIEARAFYGCSQIGRTGTVDIGNGHNALQFNTALESIGANAFANCYRIEAAIFTYHLKDVDVNAFGMFPNITIYVYEDSEQVKYEELFKMYNGVKIQSLFTLDEEESKK